MEEIIERLVVGAPFIQSRAALHLFPTLGGQLYNQGQQHQQAMEPVPALRRGHDSYVEASHEASPSPPLHGRPLHHSFAFHQAGQTNSPIFSG